MAAYNSPNYLNPDPNHTNYCNPTNYPKLIRVKAHTRWRLGKLEHVAAHWRYVYNH